MSWLSRVFLLYIIGAVICFKFIDENKVNVRILNYLRSAGQYVTKYATQQQPYDRESFVEAVEYFSRVNQLMPQLNIYHGALGYSYYHLEQYDQALAQYAKAIETNPELFGFYYNQGMIYFKKGEWQKAADIISRGLGVDPNKSFLYISAIAHKMLGREKIRTAWIQKESLALKQGYKDGLKILLICYYNLGRYKEVLGITIKQIENNAEDKEFFHYYAGKAAEQLGVDKQAFYHLNEYIKLDKENIEVYSKLVNIVERLNNPVMVKALKIRIKDLKNKGIQPRNFENDLHKIYYYVPPMEI